MLSAPGFANPTQKTAVFFPAAIRTILSPEACLVPLFLFVVGRAQICHVVK